MTLFRLAMAALALAVLSGGCIELDPPRWSPDGRRVAFVEYRTQAAPRLWLLEPESDPPVRLLGEDAVAPCWDADGRTLFCLMRNRAGLREIRRIHLTTTPPTHTRYLHLQGGEITDLERAAAGRELYYIKETQGDRTWRYLYRGFVNENTELLLSSPEHCVEAMAVSPDGRRAAYSTFSPAESGTADAPCHIYVADANGNAPPRKVASAGTAGGRPWRLRFVSPTALVLFDNSPDVLAVTLSGRADVKRWTVAPAESNVLSVEPVEGRQQVVVTVVSPDRKVRALSVELSSGHTTELEAAQGELVGLRSQAPRPLQRIARYAEAGVHISDRDGTDERFFPLNDAQLGAAVDRLLATNRLQDAQRLLNQAQRAVQLEWDWLGDLDVGALHLRRAQVLMEAGKLQDGKEALLHATLAYPLRSAGPDVDKLLDRAMATGDPLVALVRDGLAAWQQGDLGLTRRQWRRAVTTIAEPERVAGAHFNLGLAELRSLEQGIAGARARLASRHFAVAASEKTFGQRDYAAVLEALAWTVGDSPQLRRTFELMQKAYDYHPDSPLVADLRAVRNQLKQTPPGQWRVARKVAGEHSTFFIEKRVRYRVRLDVDAAAGRRVSLEEDNRWRLRVGPDARRAATLVPEGRAELARVVRSPDGIRVALLARSGGNSELLVIDPMGRFVHGSLAALQTGRLPAGRQIVDLRWVDGETIDYDLVGEEGRRETRTLSLAEPEEEE